MKKEIQKLKAIKMIATLLVIISMVISNPAYSSAEPINVGDIPEIPYNSELGLHVNDIVAYMNTPAGRNLSSSTIQGLLNKIDKVDSKKPIVTLTTLSPQIVGTNIQATSNKAGLLYLVKASTNPDLISLEAAIALAKTGKKIEAHANVLESIPTSALDPGDYKLYAVDASGNISTPLNFSLSVIAANGSISGTVNNSNNVPLQFAVVKLNGTTTTTTDVMGHYSFTNVTPGTGYIISFEKAGYATNSIGPVALASNETKTLETILLNGPIIDYVYVGGGDGGLNKNSNTPQDIHIQFTLNSDLTASTAASHIYFDLSNIELAGNASWDIDSIDTEGSNIEGITASKIINGSIGITNARIGLTIGIGKTLVAGDYELSANHAVSKTADLWTGLAEITVDGYYKQGYYFSLGNPLDEINDIISTESGRSLTLDLFGAIGVSGVNAGNLTAIEQLLRNISGENYLYEDEIQGVVDTYNSHVSSFRIYGYYNSEFGYGDDLIANKSLNDSSQAAEIRFTTTSNLSAGSTITIALSDVMIDATPGDWYLDGESGLGPNHSISFPNTTGTLSKAKDAIIVISLGKALMAGSHSLSGEGVIASTSNNYDEYGEGEVVRASADITLSSYSTRTYSFQMFPEYGELPPAN